MRTAIVIGRVLLSFWAFHVKAIATLPRHRGSMSVDPWVLESGGSGILINLMISGFGNGNESVSQMSCSSHYARFTNRNVHNARLVVIPSIIERLLVQKLVSCHRIVYIDDDGLLLLHTPLKIV